MKVSLPLLLVVCLLGFAYCDLASDSDNQREIKKKVICEECEFSQYELNENEMDKIKMVKMKHCLASKKRQIAKENDKREKRDVESKDSASFQELFKTSSSFKKLLNELLDMKEEVSQRATKFETDMQKAVNELVGQEKNVKKANNWWKMEKKMKSNQPAECDQKLRCEANKVIKIKEAILTSQDQEDTCSSVNKYLPIQIDSLNDVCYNKDEATKRLSDLCDGETECEVSLVLYFNTLCDCSAKKHLSVEYVCEPASSHTVKKRSLYYQTRPAEIRRFDNFRRQILDYYDWWGDDEDYYYDVCAYYDYYPSISYYYYGNYNSYDDYYGCYYDDDSWGGKGGKGGKGKKGKGHHKGGKDDKRRNRGGRNGGRDGGRGGRGDRDGGRGDRDGGRGDRDGFRSLANKQAKEGVKNLASMKPLAARQNKDDFNAAYSAAFAKNPIRMSQMGPGSAKLAKF